MCGRYAATLPPEMMQELFQLLNTLDVPPRYNIKPTEPIVAIWETHGERRAHLARWGLVPAWVRNPREFPLLINARSDGMAEKPAFRDAVKWRRCIVPADGYYEWMKSEDGRKQPYFIHAANGETLAFAGLYATWTGPEGEKVDSAAIVTVDPNLELSGIHDRMPAVLWDKDAIDAWLDTEHVPAEMACSLIATPPEGVMVCHVVGRAVGRSDAEGPDLIRPLTPEEAAAEAGSYRPRKKAAANAGQLSLF